MAKGLLAAAIEALKPLVSAVATDPRKLKPGQLTRLLNSTPAGQVLTDRKLRGHRERAGRRVGDDKHVDLLRYAAWLAGEHHAVSRETTRLPAPPDDRYDAKKERERKRNASIAESGRDVGPLPRVACTDRRASATKSLRVFCETYFARSIPPRFNLTWSPDHLKVIDRIERAIDQGGQFALAMPRGSGKTTILEAAVLWATLTGRRVFILLVGASRAAALESMDSIKSDLESNDFLAADFPEVCVPIQKLDGIANRCKGQLHAGERTHIGWSKEQVILPTIAGSPASGAIVRVAGITGRVRGMKYLRADGKTVRPDLVLIDDPQTDKSAKSETQCEQRERIISGAILGLAGPGEKISAFCTCTVVRSGDLADVLLDRDKHPDWQGERCKLLYAFPTNTKLWEDYAILRADSLRNGGDGREATEFYRKHRKAMDAGAIVGWPERHKPDEISGLQNAMNLKLDNEAAFFAEYQNEPLADETLAEQLNADDLAKRGNNLKRGLVPLGCSRLTAFFDIQKKAIWWAVCGWTDSFGGCVVDVGTWPDQDRRYYTLADIQRSLAKEFPRAGLEAQIYQGLTACATAVLGRKWMREDLAELSIELALVDANWGESTDIVYQWCRETPHRAIVMPSHGKYIGARSKPFHEWTRKQGERLGNHWMIPNVAGKRAIRHVLIDTNWWKSFVAARLTTPVGDRGALVLAGKPGSDKRLLCEHLTSEFFVPTIGHDRKVDEWTLRPGRDNHWWDGITGCAVAASMRGLQLNAGPGEKPATPKTRPRRERVSYF